MDPMDLREAFANNLRRLRHAKCTSQEDLAYEAGVNRTYLSKLEKGESYPGLEISARRGRGLGAGQRRPPHGTNTLNFVPA
jgi:DNA-binding XRE family transcriptional regulator